MTQNKCDTDHLAHPNAQTPSGPAHIPFHVLYSDHHDNIGKIFHALVQRALEGKRRIFPVWTPHEQEIRTLWAQQNFDCAFVVINNIIVPQSCTPEERLRIALELISWMRKQSSAIIIAFSGLKQPEIEEETIRNGADKFFHLPFPASEVKNLLEKRFSGPDSS